MAEVNGPGVHFSYETAGDGFPLVLTPGPQGVWSPYMPLLGELCRTILYTAHDLAEIPPAEALHPRARAAALLDTFLDTLSLERVYLASQAVSWHIALHFALHYAGRLEGLMLIGARDVETHAVCSLMALEARLHEITVPTVVVIEAESRAVLPYADLLTARLSHCTKFVVSDTVPAASSSIPALRLGHAMMRFLLHCERQRNLVRGASFLL
jgi:pimeloyl-ACP methyl ester carboxylesterase